MSKLPRSLTDKAKNYLRLPIEDKQQIIDQLYNRFELSWSEIAEMCNTYPNRVRRDAVKMGFSSRTKSEAQKLALETARHPHPTRGKGHSDSAKIKISEAIAKEWENMSEDEREAKRQEAKQRWENKTDEEINKLREAAGKAVRLAAKEGSALEKFLLRELIHNGYKVEFHKERWVSREKLQIDLFIPSLNVAIEVDGPSHFTDIWGEENLRKNKERDSQKNGLLLERGCIIIRIQQRKTISKKYKRDILQELLSTLKQIENKSMGLGNRYFVLGDKDE